MRWAYRRTVKRVEKRVAKKWISGVGENAKFNDESLGWYALFIEEPSALFLGEYPDGEKPEMNAGDNVEIIVEVTP